MVPHFVLAISVYYAANALRRDVETDRGSDMQVRATGTVNGSDVAHDQSLSSKGRLSNPSPGINAKELFFRSNATLRSPPLLLAAPAQLLLSLPSLTVVHAQLVSRSRTIGLMIASPRK
eukprot:TRINITY_DN1625_c0_g1_i3.p1 TRINITY_DN1625_c0_g1~~TRINITY_DN1625_c0_g1_i3.p1  ORF type:complete len:119 (+),score=2.18 TRINITY_DN1625_c0_g1_i3:63-419(+)